VGLAASDKQTRLCPCQFSAAGEVAVGCGFTYAAMAIRVQPAAVADLSVSISHAFKRHPRRRDLQVVQQETRYYTMDVVLETSGSGSTILATGTQYL
jgi:hypothetical protein